MHRLSGQALPSERPGSGLGTWYPPTSRLAQEEDHKNQICKLEADAPRWAGPAQGMRPHPPCCPPQRYWHRLSDFLFGSVLAFLLTTNGSPVPGVLQPLALCRLWGLLGPPSMDFQDTPQCSNTPPEHLIVQQFKSLSSCLNF